MTFGAVLILEHHLPISQGRLHVFHALPIAHRTGNLSWRARSRGDIDFDGQLFYANAAIDRDSLGDESTLAREIYGDFNRPIRTRFDFPWLRWQFGHSAAAGSPDAINQNF